MKRFVNFTGMWLHHIMSFTVILFLRKTGYVTPNSTYFHYVKIYLKKIGIKVSKKSFYYIWKTEALTLQLKVASESPGSCSHRGILCASVFEIKYVIFWMLWSRKYIFFYYENKDSLGWPNRCFGFKKIHWWPNVCNAHN